MNPNVPYYTSFNGMTMGARTFRIDVAVGAPMQR